MVGEWLLHVTTLSASDSAVKLMCYCAGLRQNKGKITENSENHCLDKTVKVNLIRGLKLLQKPPTHGPAKAARTELCLSFGQIIDNFFSRLCFVITFTAVNFIATLQCFITEETKP